MTDAVDESTLKVIFEVPSRRLFLRKLRKDLIKEQLLHWSTLLFFKKLFNTSLMTIETNLFVYINILSRRKTIVEFS